MPGQAIVTINDRQWTVEVASTQTELMTGLAGRTSLTPGTGMLFILPSTQQVTVTTQDMLFPIDIIFIANNTVLDVASNIQPGYEVTEETPCDMFLEVNAGEASVSSGDTVSVEYLSTVVDNISQIMSFAVPLAALGFVCAMAGGMLSSTSSSSHSSAVRRLGSPRTEEERAEVHEEFYGTKELPARGKGLEERGELGEYITITDPGKTTFKPGEVVSKEAFDKENERVRKLGEREAKGISSREHHSMWLSTKQREECEKEAGAIACRWAEEFVAPGDFESAKKAAKVFYEKMREAIGIA